MKRAALTWYAELSRGEAWLVVGAFAALLSACLLVSGDVRTIDVRGLHHELNDSEVFRAVAARVHAGESYYGASAIELPAHGYPTASVFNWRLPTYAWIFGWPPDPSWGRGALILSVLASIALAIAIVARAHGRWMGLAVAVSLASADLWVFYPEPAYFMEFWAGTWILIALCLHFQGRWAWSVAAGSMALLLRELAIVFVVAMPGAAVRYRRWKEAAAWGALLASYCVVFFFHLRAAARHGAGPSLVQDLGWFAFGGLGSVLSTARMNYVLAILPRWTTACFVPLAILGLLGWNAPRAAPFKMVALAYLAAFAVVGRPFNFYWGWLDVPLLSLGLAFAPTAAWELGTSLVRSGAKAAATELDHAPSSRQLGETDG